MILEHAETVDNPPKISAQSLALVGALFYEESGPDDACNIMRGLTETDLDRRSE